MLTWRWFMVFAVGYHTRLRDLTFGLGLAIKLTERDPVLMVPKAYQITYIGGMGTSAQTIGIVAPNGVVVFNAGSIGHRILVLA